MIGGGGLLDAGPTLIDSLTGDGGGDSGGDVSVTSTDTSDSSGEDYRGQDELSDLYTPTLDDPAIDDDGYQGEGSWMDFDKSEDGAGSRYDRDTAWTTDVALQFDSETVQDLTVPDVEYSDEAAEAYSEPGQTLDDVADSLIGRPDATRTDDAPETFNQSDPGLDGPGPSWLPAAGVAALVVSVIVAIVAAVGGETTDG